MKKLAILLAFILTACTSAPLDRAAQESSAHASHGAEGDATAALDRLNASPRHQEWVEVKNGDKTIYTWVVYPETSDKRPVALLIHENRGLTDWVRAMADHVAEAGAIAVAPDLLSGFSATRERTSDFPDEDAARNAISQLNLDTVMSDLRAVAAWAETIPATNGKIASAGFCWGGARSFQFATVSDDLDATLVFYGTGPEEASAYANVSSPVFGFYGGADERVNATIDESKRQMTAAGKQYDVVIYEGAGHAFMRSGEDPNADPANKAARSAAWERMKEILSGL